MSLSGFKKRNYVSYGKQPPFSKPRATLSFESDYVKNEQEATFYVSEEYYLTFPEIYGVDVECSVRGLYQFVWSETVAGHGSNEFLSVIFKCLKEMHTGAGWLTWAMDGARTNLNKNLLKLFQLITDPRSGPFYMSCFLGLWWGYILKDTRIWSMTSLVPF
jgi:hypothetical protein